MRSRLFLDASSPLEHACEATINISTAKLEPLEARSVYLTAYSGRSVKLKKTRSVFGDTSYQVDPVVARAPMMQSGVNIRGSWF